VAEHAGLEDEAGELGLLLPLVEVLMDADGSLSTDEGLDEELSEVDVELDDEDVEVDVEVDKEVGVTGNDSDEEEAEVEAEVEVEVGVTGNESDEEDVDVDVDVEVEVEVVTAEVGAGAEGVDPEMGTNWMLSKKMVGEVCCSIFSKLNRTCPPISAGVCRSDAKLRVINCHEVVT